MAHVPTIDSPCPIRWNAMPTAERNFCTQCERKVHNLDGMSDGQRREFLAACSGSVCVAYTVRPARSALSTRAGLGLAAALALSPMLVGAQDMPQQSPVEASSLTPKAEFIDCDHEKGPDAAADDKVEMIIVGGVSNPRGARWQDEASTLPTLPDIAADALVDAQIPSEFIAAPADTAK
ncbi:MAG: hypothetical protein ABI411_05950 [Tahibacter sp.]